MRQIIQILVIFATLMPLSACRWNNNHQPHGYIEGRFTYVASQTTGTLQQLFVQRGDQIKQGGKLFSLNPYPQNTQLREAQAKLKQAKANLANLKKGRRPTEIAAMMAQKKQVESQLDFAHKTLIRYKKLYKKGFIEKAKLDEAQANNQNFKNQLFEINENLKTAHLGARSDEISAAKENVKASKAALATISWQLQQKAIRAPIAGFVFDTFYTPGEVVPTNYPVIQLLAPQNIYAVYFIPEKELASTHLGQKVTITCDHCQPVSATINYISPKAEFTPPVIYSEKSRSKLVYRIEAHFSLKDAIKFHPGQPITINN